MFAQTATAGRTERPGVTSLVPSQRPAVSMRLSAHDIASSLPAAIRSIVQKGLLDRVFQDALVPEWIFPAQADVLPWVGQLGDEKVWTRKGLIAPKPTPLTPGADPATSTYGIEQWKSTLDRWGDSVTTDMLASAVTLGNKYLADVEQLGISAGQSMNQAARNALYYGVQSTSGGNYGGYAGGRTWVTAGTSSSTTLPVKELSGFAYKSVNGVLTAVSGTNALSVTVNGVANTVTAVSAESGAGNLTLGSAVSASIGQAVVAANAPASVRPTGNTPYDLGSGNIATLALFRSAYTRLKKMNVPMIGGGYTAFVTNDTINQLYSDADFKLALTGQVESPVWRNLALGRINGIDFVPNNEVPTLLAGSSGTLTVNRCIMLGGGALVWSPLENIGSLLRGTGVEGVPSISMISPAQGVDVALIVRPPQNLFQDQVSTTWEAVGGFGLPTDLNSASGDPSLLKRAVVIDHA